MAAAANERTRARMERRQAALAARSHMSPSGPAPDHFRVATWNVMGSPTRATVRTTGWRSRHGILAGDMNVAPTDSDIFHPDAFVGLTHVTVPEREAWAHLLATGLVDVDAARWGAHERRFTWWNHGLNYSRNLGMRIDMIAADPELARRVVTTWIDHVERGAERPSDHAALLADFDLAPHGQ
ncbi:MAG: endonuclease/exonuclease/phosphatase family protein [Acidimicrobiales bacterium]